MCPTVVLSLAVEHFNPEISIFCSIKHWAKQAINGGWDRFSMNLLVLL